MEYRRIQLSRKTNSLSPYKKNISVTNNSSSSKNKNYTTKTTNSLSTHNYYNIEKKNENDEYNYLLKEKNIIIQKLQNQINKLINNSNEKNQKIKVQQNIIDSLNEQIRQLTDELATKNLIIKQNKNIENKIFELQNEYLTDNSNSGNSLLYLESIRDYISKLTNKEEEINTYKKQIKLLNMKLNEKENEIIKKNELLKKYIIYYKERNINLLNNNNYDNLSQSTGKKAKSLKNQNFDSDIFQLKNDINHVNLYTNKYSNIIHDNNEFKRNDSNLKNNYIKLLDNYNELKKKYNYYYKISHNFK